MKMSDTFDLPLEMGHRSVYIDNDAKPCILSGGTGALIARPKYIQPVMHAVNNHDRLTEENQKLREALVNVLHAESHNTGHEPSLSVFHRSVDEALQLLEELDK